MCKVAQLEIGKVSKIQDSDRVRLSLNYKNITELRFVETEFHNLYSILVPAILSAEVFRDLKLRGKDVVPLK